MAAPRSRLLRAAVLLSGVLLAGCGDAPSGPRTLILANVHPASYPTARGLQDFAEVVAADPVLAPVFRIDLQLAGVLGNEKETLEKLGFGGIQLVASSAAPLAEFSDRIGVLTLPYLFAGQDHLWRMLEGPVGEELLASLAEAGFVGLAWYEAGARSFYNRKRPVRRLEDLRGLKIRVQKSELMRRTVEALGATPVALGFKDVYSNLLTGALDGAENNLPSYRSERHFEGAPFYSFDRHSMIPDLLLVGRETWEGLTEAQRRALRAAARASSDAQRRYWDEYVEEARRTVLEAGAELDEVEDLEPFRRAVEPLYAEHAARFGDLVERIRAVATTGTP